MDNYKAKVLSDEKYLLGEGPAYDIRNGQLSFVDILDNKFYTLSEFGELSSIDLGQPIGAAIPLTQEGAYVLCGMDGLYVCKGNEISKFRDLTDVYESYQRSNDAKADPKGRLWFGSSSADDDHGFTGNLFRYDNGTIKVMQKDTRISNGLAWSSDGKRFFFSDSEYHAVFAYDYDEASGDISNRQVLFEVKDGVSDGMCIDSEDNLWVAIWGGRRIEKRSTATGELLGIVEVDAQNVTSCCFCGPRLDTLFITTSGNGQTGEHDGCLFTCRVDTWGCPSDFVALKI
jgi:gluconolactonase